MGMNKLLNRIKLFLANVYKVYKYSSFEWYKEKTRT